MTIATQPLTLEEFLALSDTKPAAEFIHGKVITPSLP